MLVIGLPACYDNHILAEEVSGGLLKLFVNAEVLCLLLVLLLVALRIYAG